MKRNIHRKQIINFLMLLLCASLLTGTAFANETEVVELDREGINPLTSRCTLSDGRVLLVGYRVIGEEYVPRLVCLNGDRTVSWDYVGKAPDDGLFTNAAELQDGTIGVCFRRRGDLVLWFFTPDGKPAREEIVLPNKGNNTYVTNVTGSRLQLIYEELTKQGDSYSVDSFEAHLIDWDGNEIAPLEDFSLLFTGSPMIEVADGLVMSGTTHDGPVVIMKTDLQGNVLWKKPVSRVCPDTIYATAEYIIPTEDGGYLAVQAEHIPENGDEIGDYRTVLVKLDSEGNTLWTNSEAFGNITDVPNEVCAFGGKYAISFTHYADDFIGYTMDRARTVVWFDENGTSLGTVTIGISPENIETLESYIREQAEGRKLIPIWLDNTMISLQDGLWMNGIVCLMDETNDAIRESYTSILVKIPEP